MLKWKLKRFIFEIELCYDYRHKQALERLLMTSLFRKRTTKKSKNIMPKLATLELTDLSHCLQRAEALIQVLGEAAIQNGNDHQAIQIEIIEEYLLKSRKILRDHQI